VTDVVAGFLFNFAIAPMLSLNHAIEFPSIKLFFKMRLPCVFRVGCDDIRDGMINLNIARQQLL
jgi:hypothetical protein